MELRSTYVHEDWKELTAVRIKRETERLYPHRVMLDAYQ